MPLTRNQSWHRAPPDVRRCAPVVAGWSDEETQKPGIGRAAVPRH
jgi:hypothetical protein